MTKSVRRLYKSFSRYKSSHTQCVLCEDEMTVWWLDGFWRRAILRRNK